MAITHVGTEFYHNPEGTSAGAVHSVNVPAGTQNGDYMVLVTYGSTASITVPAGWTLLRSDTASTVLRFDMYHRIASSEPASYTINANNNTRGTAISVFRGVDTTSLAAAVDDHDQNINVSSSDPISAAGVVNGTTGSKVYTARATRGSTAVQCRHTSSDTELADFGGDNGTTTRDCCIYLSDEKPVGVVAGVEISLTGGSGTHSITYNIVMSPPVRPEPNAPSVTVSANSPTVTTASNLNAAAGHASATVVARNATGSTVTAKSVSAGHATASVSGKTPTADTDASGVQFVAAGTHSSTTSASDISARMPVGISVGDLLLVGYGNVGNEAGNPCSPASGWTVLEESTAGSNAYYVMLGKIATSTEVADAGNVRQVATYGNGTSGQSVRSSVCLAYTGVANDISLAVVDTGFLHESFPANQTVETGTATATATDQWWVGFGAMASGGDQTASSFTVSAGVERAEIDDTSGTTSGVVGFDSAGTIATGAHQYSATWSGAASRLNGSIAIISPPFTPPSASPTAGTASVTAAANGVSSVRTAEPVAGAASATAVARSATVATVGNVTASAGHAEVSVLARDAVATIPGQHDAFAAATTTVSVVANSPSVTALDGIRNANAGTAQVWAFANDPTSTAPAPELEEILPTNANWNIWIDWDKDLGVNLTSFETGSTEGWQGAGNPAPNLVVDKESPSQPVKHGRYSLRVEWTIDTNPVTTPITFGLAGHGFDDGSFNVNNPPVEGAFVTPTVERTLTGLVVGRQYTATAWFYVPTGSPDVRLQCNGFNGSYTTALNQWVQASVEFTATDTEHDLVIDPETDPSTTTQVLYVESVQLTHDTEPVQDRVLGTRQSISFKYGRDTARSLEAMSPTEATFELDNSDLELSPDNPDSVYAPYLVPGRPIYVRADWEDRFYSMFYGYLDSYTLKPGIEDDSVEFGAQDMLAQLGEFELSTEVYASLQTGDALHIILDELGWPQHRRSIDRGATTVSWWSEHQTDALEAVKKLVDSEGLPAFAYVDRHGNFVFRDRHHRYLDRRSLESQATFYSGRSDEEPQFCEPFEYDLGWTDLINKVDFEVEVRGPRPLEEVFSMEDETLIQLKQGEAYVVDVDAGDPFIQALTPRGGTVVVTDTSSGGEAGEEEEEVFDPPNADYVMRSGTATSITATLDRTSGQTCKITFTAHGGDAVISNVRLRARPIQVMQTFRVTAEDAASVSEHGPRSYDGEAPWANPYDADAIARTIIGTRAERLPIVSFTVNSGNETRYMQVLERDLSDRIHLIEAKTFTDHDFFIESIEHDIGEVGWDHRATFSCERVKDLPVANSFEFGSATAGFDEGVFGGIGFTLPENMFVLGKSQLNQDKLNT